MSKHTPPSIPHRDAEPIDLRQALEERYLAYALSTIMHRALPDARDGLKPVHRRRRTVRHQWRLDPGAAFKKCAKIVGDVMGSYHPHGDASIYDALVRLAQDFSVRYPLVDGQGNFGNIDGDNAAAYRYTEARMTDVALLLLQGLEEDTVEFRPNYDGSLTEPVVLPGAFPNLLANGSSGIAVGMATSIPPHNAAELCDAALHLIKNPDAGTEALVKFVRGPDFPTGGILVDDATSILEGYKTGRGSYRLRARWQKEDLARGGWQIVITEIPFMVQKGRLIEKIAELMGEKKLPLLADVRDESAEDVRVVLEPRSRTVDDTVLMEQMFRACELEVRIPLNMNVLSGGRVPKVMSLHAVLKEWLDHRRDVLVRRSQFRLEAIARRLEILSGYLVAYLNLDEVIRIVREEDEPRPALMARFSLNETQAEAILNMRLRALRKLEEMEIRTEHATLMAEQDKLKTLLASEPEQWNQISAEVKAVRDAYGPRTPLGKRRTEFASIPDIEVDLEASFIEREPVTVICSEKGWIRALKGHVDDVSALVFKEGDALKFAVKAETTDRLLLLATSGKFFTLEASKLPGGRGHGDPVRLMADIEASDAILSLLVARPDSKFLIASNAGDGFVVSGEDCLANTRKGKQILNVTSPVEALVCRAISPGDDLVASVGENRKLLIFPLGDLPEMSRGKGVRLQKFKDGSLADVTTFARAGGLVWRDGSDRNWTVTDFAEWLGERGQAGRLPPRGFPRSNKFS